MIKTSISELFQTQSNYNEQQNKLDIRNAPQSVITKVVVTSIRDPKPFYPLQSFDFVDGKYKPVFSQEQAGFEVRAVAPSSEDISKDKFIKLVVPTLEIAKKMKFRGLYTLINPRGKQNYKSYEIYEIYADDEELIQIKPSNEEK